MADLTLTCGCTAVVTHTRGDRRIYCTHGHAWIVTADVVFTGYNIRPASSPDPGPAAA